MKKKIAKKLGIESTSDIVVPEIPVTTTNLSYLESNSLYNIAGYLITSIVKQKQKVCKNCFTKLGGFRSNLNKYSRLTSLKCYKTKSLFFINEKTFDFFLKMECIFRTYFPVVYNIKNFDLNQFFIKKFEKIFFHVPDCHCMKLRIIRRFTAFRLKIKSEKLKKNKHFSSKSMAMHNDIH